MRGGVDMRRHCIHAITIHPHAECRTADHTAIRDERLEDATPSIAIGRDGQNVVGELWPAGARTISIGNR